MLHISYLYRIHTVTFLPFRAYNTDNQLIINTLLVITSIHKLKLKLKNVLAEEFFPFLFLFGDFENDSN